MSRFGAEDAGHPYIRTTHSSQQTFHNSLAVGSYFTLQIHSPDSLLPVATIPSLSSAATGAISHRVGADRLWSVHATGFRYQVCWERIQRSTWPCDPHHHHDGYSFSCPYLMSVMPRYDIVAQAGRRIERSLIY